MNLISRCILAILALASVIAVSNAGLAAASNKPILGWSAISPYGHSDAHVAMSLVTPYIAPIKTLGNWGQTCKAACAEARKSFLMVATKRLEACLLDADYSRIAKTLYTIYNDFNKNHAEYGIEPLHVPSCFNPAYTHEERDRCLWNLWHFTQGAYDFLWPIWAKPSLKNLAHAAVVGFMERDQMNDLWFHSFANQQKELLLAKIQPDDEWAVSAYQVLILILQGGNVYLNDSYEDNNAILSALQHARSALLCRLVKDAIKLHVDPKLQRVTGGVTTLEMVLSNIFSVLEKSPLFPAISLLYRGNKFNPLEDIRKCGNVGLGDIINGLVDVFHPPISANDKNYLIKKLLHGALPVGSDLKDFSDQLLEKITNSFIRIPSNKHFETAITSALEKRLPSKDIEDTDDNPLSDNKADEWLEWQWSYMVLKHIAANDRVSVAVRILKVLTWKKLIPKWVDPVLLKKELKALAVKPSWKTTVAKIKSKF